MCKTVQAMSYRNWISMFLRKMLNELHIIVVFKTTLL